MGEGKTHRVLACGCDNDLDEDLAGSWLGNGRVDDLDGDILVDKCFLHDEFAFSYCIAFGILQVGMGTVDCALVPDR